MTKRFGSVDTYFALVSRKISIKLKAAESRKRLLESRMLLNPVLLRFTFPSFESALSSPADIPSKLSAPISHAKSFISACVQRHNGDKSEKRVIRKYAPCVNVRETYALHHLTNYISPSIYV